MNKTFDDDFFDDGIDDMFDDDDMNNINDGIFWCGQYNDDF